MAELLKGKPVVDRMAEDMRGRIAAKKEQYENAILYLQQAREVEGLSRLLRRELLLALERCYSETQQYKQVYECAAAQREL